MVGKDREERRDDGNLSPSPRAAGTLLRDTHAETRRTARQTGLSEIERVRPTSAALSTFNVRLVTIQ